MSQDLKEGAPKCPIHDRDATIFVVYEREESPRVICSRCIVRTFGQPLVDFRFVDDERDIRLDAVCGEPIPEYPQNAYPKSLTEGLRARLRRGWRMFFEVPKW